MNQEYEEENPVCKLCNREQPIYFYQQEEVIKRLPERSLTPLLKNLKTDVIKQPKYLSFLKVSAKFV